MSFHIDDEFNGRFAFGHTDEKTRVVCDASFCRGRMFLSKALCDQRRIRCVFIQANLTIHGIAIKTFVDDVEQCASRKLLRTCDEQMCQNVFVCQQTFHFGIIRIAKSFLTIRFHFIWHHDFLLCYGAPMLAYPCRMMTSAENCDGFLDVNFIPQHLEMRLRGRISRCWGNWSPHREKKMKKEFDVWF